jgi:hypothetical protein
MEWSRRLNGPDALDYLAQLLLGQDTLQWEEPLSTCH